MTRLIANRPFRYDSRELSADEEFEAESKHILVLTGVNNPLARSASAAAEVEPRTFQADAETDLLDQDKKPRRYNRRDMRAKE